MCEQRYAASDRMRLKRDIVRVAAGIEDEPRVLPFVLGAAGHAPDERVRETAIRALGELDDSQGVVHRRLCAWLHDGSYRVRGAAARALGERGDPRAIPQLRARAGIEAEPQVLAALERALNALR
jgi:HEAT repeat protein